MRMYRSALAARSIGGWLALAMLLALVPGFAIAREERLVRTPAEYEQALDRAQPGDRIVLVDGEWRDFRILFNAEGEAERPITLTAQTPGGVILTGQSNLRMAGRHLVVSNLVFRDGWSPTGEVVSFRQNRQNRAVNSRVTGLVIDGFSKPNRAESDNWVAMYGYGNRFDHSHLIGKSNAGTTLVVVRDEEQGLENRHLIDHNWFGPRPPLGSNGGETIRIGTSHDSESSSFTTVTANWFERTNGEVEIISNKSGENTYRGNVFFEAEGALTLRHGDGALVEDNVFIGNGRPNTGGIRVINRNNTVRNNYMEGLRGESFASALTILYGVPNSPLNRYVQVQNAVIENNTLIDVAEVALGEGMDAERSAPPIDSRFVRNLIVNRGGADAVQLSGDLSGIAFAGNVVSTRASVLPGAEMREVSLSRGRGGLMTPLGVDGVGARRDLAFVARNAVGVSWYPKDALRAALDSGRTIAVAAEEDALTQAAREAAPGDRLVLAAGDHLVNAVIAVEGPLSVEGPSQGEARILFSRPTLFEIGRHGSLKLSQLSISGAEAPDSAGNAVVRARGDAFGYRLELSDVQVSHLVVNRAFDLIAAQPGSLASRIVLTAVTVEDLSGSVLRASAETQDLGTYNAEVVEVSASTFRRVAGPAIDLYRGGTDESTFGPRLTVRDSVFEGVGRSGATPAAIRMVGVQRAELASNHFSESGPVRFERRVGAPVLIWRDNHADLDAPLVSNVEAQ